MSGAVPSHHDDHHGGVDGYTADRPGIWRRSRIAAITWNIRGRRADILAGRYALPESRGLHLSGTGQAVVDPRIREKAARDARGDSDARRTGSRRNNWRTDGAGCRAQVIRSGPEESPIKR